MAQADFQMNLQVVEIAVEQNEDGVLSFYIYLSINGAAPNKLRLDPNYDTSKVTPWQVKQMLKYMRQHYGLPVED